MDLEIVSLGGTGLWRNYAKKTLRFFLFNDILEVFQRNVKIVWYLCFTKSCRVLVKNVFCCSFSKLVITCCLESTQMHFRSRKFVEWKTRRTKWEPWVDWQEIYPFPISRVSPVYKYFTIFICSLVSQSLCLRSGQRASTVQARVWCTVDVTPTDVLRVCRRWEHNSRLYNFKVNELFYLLNVCPVFSYTVSLG